MTHRKDLLKQGFVGGFHGSSKLYLQRQADQMKKMGMITHYRIVKDSPGWELYARYVNKIQYMLKHNKLDENEVYWIGKNEAVMIHLVGGTVENIKSRGWYLFKGQPGKMRPVTSLTSRQAYELVKTRLIEK